MKRLFFILFPVLIFSSCGKSTITVEGGPSGYRTIEDRIYLSNTSSTLFFTIENPTKPIFERYVINEKGEKIKVYYKDSPEAEPEREYETERINENAFYVRFFASTPLEGDTTSIDILEFESGRIDTIKTIFSITYPETFDAGFVGGSSVVLKKAWYNNKLFINDFVNIDSIVVKN